MGDGGWGMGAEDGGRKVCSVNEPSRMPSPLSAARNGVISSLENVFKQQR